MYKVSMRIENTVLITKGAFEIISFWKHQSTNDATTRSVKTLKRL